MPPANTWGTSTPMRGPCPCCGGEVGPCRGCGTDSHRSSLMAGTISAILGFPDPAAFVTEDAGAGAAAGEDVVPVWKLGQNAPRAGTELDPVAFVRDSRLPEPSYNTEAGAAGGTEEDAAAAEVREEGAAEDHEPLWRATVLARITSSSPLPSRRHAAFLASSETASCSATCSDAGATPETDPPSPPAASPRNDRPTPPSGTVHFPRGTPGNSQSIRAHPSTGDVTFAETGTLPPLKGTFSLRGELMHAFVCYRVTTEG
ncbi:hypothetical protein T484DRAFT_3055799, partial [Baffinella frigidus]